MNLTLPTNSTQLVYTRGISITPWSIYVSIYNQEVQHTQEGKFIGHSLKFKKKLFSSFPSLTGSDLDIALILTKIYYPELLWNS